MGCPNGHPFFYAPDRTKTENLKIFLNFLNRQNKGKHLNYRHISTGQKPDAVFSVFANRI